MVPLLCRTVDPRHNLPKLVVSLLLAVGDCVLGAWAKLWKTTIILVICSSVWNNSPPTGRIFKKFDISVVYENLSRKFEFY